MQVRTAGPIALSLVLAAGALAPAVAAPAKPKPKPKPISETYDVRGVPFVYPPHGPSCADPRLEGISTTTKTIKPTGAGTLDVTVTNFAGDWDISVLNEKGGVLASGGGTSTGEASGLTTNGTEKLVMKIKKGMTLQIAVCNFLGGPTAVAKYVFTYK